MKNSFPSLDIIVPAYNEEERIGFTIDQLARSFYCKEYPVRLIVILNGCRDQTAQVVRSRQERYPHFIEFHDYAEALGKGGAVLKGFAMATADYVSFADADGSVLATEFLRLFKILVESGDDAIIGSRHLSDSRIIVPQPWTRKIAGRVYNGLVRTMMGMPFKDTQCGGKIYNRKAAKLIATECVETGWGFDVAILHVLLTHRLRVREEAVRWINDVRSKVKLAQDGWKMFKSLWHLRTHKRKNKISYCL